MAKKMHYKKLKVGKNTLRVTCKHKAVELAKERGKCLIATRHVMAMVFWNYVQRALTN